MTKNKKKLICTFVLHCYDRLSDWHPAKWQFQNVTTFFIELTPEPCPRGRGECATISGWTGRLGPARAAWGQCYKNSLDSEKNEAGRIFKKWVARPRIALCESNKPMHNLTRNKITWINSIFLSLFESNRVWVLCQNLKLDSNVV